MKRWTRQTLWLLFVIVLLLGVGTGCTGRKQAKNTTSVLSLRYGVDHYNKFYRTVIGVDEDLNLIYHVYPADTEDYEIPYDGTLRKGSVQPIVQISKKITEEQWQALLTSDSLRNVWSKSLPVGSGEEICGTSVLLVKVATASEEKTVGGYVIDDQWLYQTGQILEQLVLSTGARAEGEKPLTRDAEQRAVQKAAEKSK